MLSKTFRPRDPPTPSRKLPEIHPVNLDLGDAHKTLTSPEFLSHRYAGDLHVPPNGARKIIDSKVLAGTGYASSLEGAKNGCFGKCISGNKYNVILDTYVKSQAGVFYTKIYINTDIYIYISGGVS